MNNETIKIHTEITPLDGLKLLMESEGKPVKGLAYTLDDKKTWVTGASMVGYDGRYIKFISNGRGSIGMLPENCAKATELDPCKSPDGCPELEPWQAFVGKLRDQPMQPADQFRFWANGPLSNDWNTKCRGGCLDDWPCCIDVRTAWAQEHFPEHCRIRAYKEPSPIASGHNPAQLTVEQVGLTNRLISKDEQDKCVSPDKGPVEYWMGGRWIPAHIGSGFGEHNTYRTQKPVGYFLPKLSVIDRFIREHKRINQTDFFVASDIHDAYEIGQANSDDTAPLMMLIDCFADCYRWAVVRGGKLIDSGYAERGSHGRLADIAASREIEDVFIDIGFNTAVGKRIAEENGWHPIKGYHGQKHGIHAMLDKFCAYGSEAMKGGKS